MNIVYTPNPLACQVYLDDQDRRLLKMAYRAELLAAEVVSLKNVREPHYDNLYQLYAHVDNLVKSCEKTLCGVHDGDCVCQPCTCMKCLAERHLGITTLNGFVKHSAIAIIKAFQEGRTLREAIEWLQSKDLEVAKRLEDYANAHSLLE